LDLNECLGKREACMDAFSAHAVSLLICFICFSIYPIALWRYLFLASRVAHSRPFADACTYSASAELFAAKFARECYVWHESGIR